jgi:hypothetical protein
MNTTKKIQLSTVGRYTGKSYSGSFEVKTVLCRNDHFEADRRRRDILGANGKDALDALKLEAFQLGQLYVRVVSGPKWWTDSESGRFLEDFNVNDELYNLATAAEDEAQAELQAEAKSALEQLAKTDKDSEKK